MAEADAITYVEDVVDMPDVNWKRNAATAAKKNSEKYKNIPRKRRLVAAIEPIEEEIPVRGQKKSKKDRNILMEAAIKSTWQVQKTAF